MLQRRADFRRKSTVEDVHFATLTFRTKSPGQVAGCKYASSQDAFRSRVSTFGRAGSSHPGRAGSERGCGGRSACPFCFCVRCTAARRRRPSGGLGHLGIVSSSYLLPLAKNSGQSTKKRPSCTSDESGRSPAKSVSPGSERVPCRAVSSLPARSEVPMDCSGWAWWLVCACLRSRFSDASKCHMSPFVDIQA